MDDDAHDEASKTLEIFDCGKDKWTPMRPKTNKRHRRYPLVWNDELDPNVVFIAGDISSNGRADKLGCIEWCDVRQNKKKFELLFGGQPINHLFGLATKKKKIDKRHWQSRALLN